MVKMRKKTLERVADKLSLWGHRSDVTIFRSKDGQPLNESLMVFAPVIFQYWGVLVTSALGMGMPMYGVSSRFSVLAGPGAKCQHDTVHLLQI